MESENAPEEFDQIGAGALHADPLQYFSHSAMACEFSIFFNQGQYQNCGDGADACFELIDDIESLLTIYRPDSEISKLNAEPTAEHELSESTLRVLQTSRKIAEQTRGAFDITAGGLTELWKEHRKSLSQPTKVEIEQQLENVGTHRWEIRQNTTYVANNDSVKLDLGAIGKGYALDCCAKTLKQMGIHDFLIHGGHSSVLARGNRRGEVGWSVGIADPLVPSKRLGVVYLKNQSLGTSGTRRQGHFSGGVWHGHIIDPRTGNPANKNFSATLITNDSSEADALSTAFFVMHETEMKSFCERHRHVQAIVTVAASQGRYQLKLFNLEEEDFQVWNEK